MIGRYQMLEQAPTAISGSLRMRMLPATDAAMVGPLWEEIERRVGTGGLTCSWAWTETWLRHYGDLVPHRFVVGERNGPCAIALVTEGVGQYRGPFPVRTVHLGTAGEPDSDTIRVEYNRLLVAPRDRAAFADGILRLIEASDLRWDELQLDGFPWDEIEPLVEPSPSFTTNTQICYVADLRQVRSTGGAVLGALRSHTAAKIRRTIRRLEAEHGPLRVEVAETQADAERIFEEMRGLHRARWEAAGKPGSFASPRFAGFHRDLVALLFDQGGIILGRVSAGDCTVGCDYGFVERNRVLSYQWGLRRFEDKRLSPGLVTGAAMMQAALERGLDEYDWLAGDVLYKRELSTTSRELIWASARRGTRIQAIYKLARAKRRVQEFRPLRAVAAALLS
jgi:CelD/BcsL family acetyltransferase involved in cellulose biosynthesis